VVPAAGTVAGAVVLVLALLFPARLGPAYESYRVKDPVDPTAIRAVPLPGQPPSGDLGGPDWVDASRAALQQGRVRVQIVAVTVGPLPPRDGSKKKLNPEEYLVIRLRANKVEGGREFRTDPMHWPGRAGEKVSPTLTDNTSKVYQERPVLDETEVVGKSSIFPVSVIDEVFTFEPPPPVLDSLRLEVPAALWGGSGAFRFTIPSAMISRQPAGPVRPVRPGS
jgi:hypothetical protein